MLSHVWRKVWPTRFANVGSTTQRQLGNIVWRLLPAGTSLFGESGPDVGAWIAAGKAVVVKDGLQRTIYRVSLPGGAVFVKRVRANTPRAWVRDLLRPTKARLEFENALALRAASIPCVEPLAFGEVDSHWPGDSFVITRELRDVEAGDIFLDKGSQPDSPAMRAIRRQVARGFGTFLARMHDAGIAHPDPHPGNFLIELPESRVLHFTLLDVHAVRFGKPLTWPQSLVNLVLFNRWFQMRASRSDRLRFWKTYISCRSTLGKLSEADSSHMARAVEAATATSNRDFWAGRTSRYLGNNRQFRRIVHGRVRGHAIRELPDDLIREWLTNPDAVFTNPGARILKASRSSTVAQLAIAPVPGCSSVIYKRFQLKSWLARVKNLFRPAPALRSWLAGQQLLDRRLATARPLAVFHRRSLGCDGTGYIVFATISDAIDLATAAALPVARAVRLAWIDQLARLIRTMHERDVSHRDLKAANILLENAGVDPAAATPVLIDLVGVTTGEVVSEQVRVRDLARLNASFLNSSAITRTHLLRFLQTYLSHGLRGHDDWKIWWTRIAQATDAKVAKNLRNNRPLA